MPKFHNIWLRSSLFALSVLPLAALADPDLLPGSDQPVKTEWVKAWQASTTTPTQFVNRLVLSESAYLVQHANNPIDWYPWSEPAFRKAEEENKLIFLSIGYASCHWCHVMESESFMDVEVASTLNKAMISIKVDREQQPDIDAWFTLAVEAINGTSGWPVSMILLPDRTPVFAANYLTKEQLITAATRLEQVWINQPEALKLSGKMLLDEVNSRMQVSNSTTLPRSAWLETAQQKLQASMDTVNGGFGNDRKFPDETKLQFLLNRYKVSKDEVLKIQLVFLLNAVIEKGLNDLVFGGIFRYTTNTQMTRPHFEKMLYNQALMVSLFSDAANWLDDPAYRAFADNIIEFVDSNMILADGTYAAAIDADHHGIEGGYYLWPANLLQEIPDNVTGEPFGDELTFLSGPMPATDGPWRTRLKNSRTEPPRKIDHSITAWNALWVSALLDNEKVDKATLLADAIWKNNWTNEQLYRMGNVPGFLDDYSYLSSAYWQLYLKTGSQKWQTRARLLDSRILDLFYSNGQISYQSSKHDQQFNIDSYQDKELPGALAVALESFENHQTEPRFVEAVKHLSKNFPAVIGSQPEYYLTLIQVGKRNFAESEKVIAKGHGTIALRPSTQNRMWQITIELDEGWHVNAAEVFDNRLIATHVLPSNAIESIRYPKGHLLSADFSSEQLNVYSQHVELEVESFIDRKNLELQVRLQACSNEVCLLPEEITLIAW